MEHILHVSIVTPTTTAYQGTALAVTVPGSQSPFQVLYNHAPIISSLDIGILRIEDASNRISVFAAKEGFIEVLQNNVNIVVEELLDAQEINEAEAEVEVDQARARYNDSSGRISKDEALRELHWAEARWRAAKSLRNI